MSRIVATVGLEMPLDFPVDAYNAIHELVKPKHDPPPDVWPEWAFSLNAIAYRFKSLADHDEMFRKYVSACGASPLPEDRYRQDRELFGFFVAGLATLESFCYALYAHASMMDSDHFPMRTRQHKRDVNPRRTAQRFQEYFPGEPLTMALTSFLADTAWEDWECFRNTLLHRLAPGRVFDAASSGAAWKGVENKTGTVTLNIDTKETPTRRGWLAKTLNDLVTKHEEFARRHVARLPAVCHG